jgi:hypothetical protein
MVFREKGKLRNSDSIQLNKKDWTLWTCLSIWELLCRRLTHHMYTISEKNGSCHKSHSWRRERLY